MNSKDKRVFTEVLNLGQSLEPPCNWVSVGQNRFVEVQWSREDWVVCRKSEGGGGTWLEGMFHGRIFSD